ncbi:MAG: DUF1697 domain-containing protein, partial [Ilumatobacteraceae bacterium]
MIPVMSAAHDYVAFIRGINVGTAHRLSMADLRAVFESIGCTDVRTVLQSGNVACRATISESTVVAAANDAFTTRFGYGGDIVVRTPAELAMLTTRNPYLHVEPDGTKVHVAFANTAPTKAAVDALDSQHAGPDEFVVDGREVFIHFPDGAGRSKLKLALGVPVTARNWKTVLRMQALFS